MSEVTSAMLTTPSSFTSPKMKSSSPWKKKFIHWSATLYNSVLSLSGAIRGTAGWFTPAQTFSPSSGTSVASVLSTFMPVMPAMA